MSDEIVQSPEASPAPEAQSSPAPQSFDNSSQQTAPQPSVWDALKSLPEYSGQDDVAIARDLYQSRQGYQAAQQQLRQYQSITAEYARNADQFRAWQESQRAQQHQAAQPAKPKWWDPPQVKDTWKQYIIRDPETGREVVAPDAPIEAQAAIRDYQAYTANFAKKFVTDPEGTLKPFIEDVAMQKAQELVQQHLGQYTHKTMSRAWSVRTPTGSTTPMGTSAPRGRRSRPTSNKPLSQESQIRRPAGSTPPGCWSATC